LQPFGAYESAFVFREKEKTEAKAYLHFGGGPTTCIMYGHLGPENTLHCYLNRQTAAEAFPAPKTASWPMPGNPTPGFRGWIFHLCYPPCMVQVQPLHYQRHRKVDSRKVYKCFVPQSTVIPFWHTLRFILVETDFGEATDVWLGEHTDNRHWVAWAYMSCALHCYRSTRQGDEKLNIKRWNVT